MPTDYARTREELTAFMDAVFEDAAEARRDL
jgi:hypothetical protein